VSSAVVPVADVREQQGALLRVELGFAAGGRSDESAGVVVVVFGELARLPPPEASRCDAQFEG
jgi:hypothetical protein